MTRPEFDALIHESGRRMQGAVDVLAKEFGGLRTGRAATSLLEPIMVDAYGSSMPITQVSTLGAPDPRTLSVQVWDKSLVKAVEKAVRESGLGLNPAVDGQLLRIPIPILILAGVFLVSRFILRRTTFGRYVYAVGGNEEAARLSGIPVGRVKVVVYMLCGGLASLAAVFHCARLTAADPNAGIGYELQAIAAVVIGGTSLMGGRGKVVNTLFGVVIIAVLESGLVQIGAQEPVKRLVTGAIIVAAVIIDYYRGKL